MRHPERSEGSQYLFLPSFICLSFRRIAAESASVFVVDLSSRAILFICHPERSEGSASAFAVALVPNPLLSLPLFPPLLLPLTLLCL
jgi:hypothetical protein